MHQVDVELSDEVKAAVEGTADQLREGRELLELGLEQVKQGVAILDAAGVRGTFSMVIEIGVDSAAAEEVPAS